MMMCLSNTIRQQQISTWLLQDELELLSNYEEFIKFLYAATQDDVVNLRLSSLGGRIDIGMILVNAIKECKATVIADVVYKCESMAAVIACSCDMLIMQKHTHLMFHAYSATYEGKSSEMTDWFAQDVKIYNSYDYDLLCPFLTKAELRQIHRGTTIYINWNDEDLTKRINRHFRLAKGK